MSLKILGFLGASLGALLGLTAGVVMWTLQEWLQPMAPVVYLASVFLCLFVLLGIGWFVTTRQELETGVGGEGESAEERGLKRLIMLASQVVLAVVALALVSLWNVEKIRAMLVPTVAKSHVRLEQPLKDKSAVVRVAACKEIFRRGWVFRSKDSLIASLNSRPKVAQKCFEAAKKNDWKGVNFIAKTLVDGWEAEMLACGETAAPRMCELVPWAVPIDQIRDAKPQVRLLRCAATADATSVRQCCADELAARGSALPEMLGDPQEFDSETANQVFAELVQYGFRPLSLPEGRQRVAAALGTDDRTVRRWVAELGCTHLDPTVAQPELMAGFVPFVETQTCELSDAEQLEYSAPAAWGRICQEILDAREDKPIEQLVCDAIAAARVERTVDEARILVHAALRAPFLQKDAGFIAAGLADAEAMFAEERRRGGGGGRLKETVSGYRVSGSYRVGGDRGSQQANKILSLNSYHDSTCEKFNVKDLTTTLGARPNVNNVETYESYDCNRVPDDMTVEEYERQVSENDRRRLGEFSNPWDLIEAESGAGKEVIEKQRENYKNAF